MIETLRILDHVAKGDVLEAHPTVINLLQRPPLITTVNLLDKGKILIGDTLSDGPVVVSKESAQFFKVIRA